MPIARPIPPQLGAAEMICAALLSAALCGVAGCTAPEAPVTAVLAPVDEGAGLAGKAFALSRHVEVRVVSLDIFAAPADPPGGAGWIELDLAIDNVDFGVPTGSTIQRSGFAIDRAAVKLLVDDTPLDPAVVDPKPGWFPPTIDIPPEGPSRMRARLRYDLPAAPAPTRVAVEIRAPGATMHIPVRGALRSAGADLRPVYVVGPDGRPIADGVVLAAGSATIDRPADVAGWRVPVDATSLGITAPGFEPTSMPLEPGDTPVIVQLRPLAEAAPWARALALPESKREAWDIDTLAERLRTREQVQNFVRRLGVIPTTGLQRSPSAVLRLGAGAPIERAELARALLARNGHATQVLCSDLPPEDAAVVYAPVTPPVLAVAADAGERAAAVRTAAAPAFAAAGTPPPGLRESFQLVPEWCDVLVAVDGVFQPLDLRPAAIARPETPLGWRASARVGEDLWRINLRVVAWQRDGQEIELLTYATDAPTLSERAFVLDLYRDDVEGARGVRPMLSILDGRAVLGQVGTGAQLQKVDRVGLEVTWVDPLRVEEPRRTVTLWERQGEVSEVIALRALLSGNTASAGLDRIADRVRAAYASRWAEPSTQLLLAEQELFASVLHRARGGLTPSVPPVMITVMHEDATGARWRFAEELLAASPAVSGGLASVDDRLAMAAGWLATLDRMNQLAGGNLEAPEPARWAANLDAMLQLPFRSDTVQMRARREAERGVWIGVQGQEKVWWYDPTRAGTAVFGTREEMGRYRDEPEPAPGPRGAMDRWTIPILCDGLPLWRAVFGAGDAQDPPACAPAPRSE